jgi:6-pyruvoyltetrahydropterin/6-carboxytetrahydropterin synthase
MGHYLLSAEAGFSAAHTLPDVDKCDRLHGHNWRVRLSVRVDEQGLDDTGMSVDFRTLEQVAKATVADFDHAYLNELDAFSDSVPTAEQVAKLVYERAASQLQNVAPAATVVEVEAWEMPGYRVAYRP